MASWWANIIAAILVAPVIAKVLEHHGLDARGAAARCGAWADSSPRRLSAPNPSPFKRRGARRNRRRAHFAALQRTFSTVERG